MRNQCYGCKRNLPMYTGRWANVHYDPVTRMPYMACTKDRYEIKLAKRSGKQ